MRRLHVFSGRGQRVSLLCKQRPVPALCSCRRSLSREGCLVAPLVILLLARLGWAAWAGILLFPSLLPCGLPKATCSDGRLVPWSRETQVAGLPASPSNKLCGCRAGSQYQQQVLCHPCPFREGGGAVEKDEWKVSRLLGEGQREEACCYNPYFPHSCLEDCE